MNVEICCITNKGKRKNGYKSIGKWWLWHSLSFIYAVYIKKLGQFFFHTYLLTSWKNKDTSVLFKLLASIKTMVITFLKILCIYVYTMSIYYLSI